ncbi:MAG: NUDIX domain-containing protein [Candidatus Andersenbacteria bacterium]
MAERVFTQVYVAVGALIEKEGKFLLVQEARGESAGKWNHPAGWLDVGEDPVKGAIREVKEETGYDFNPEHIIGIYSRVKPEARNAECGLGHNFKVIYTGTISGEGSGHSSEIAATGWFTSAEIEDMNRRGKIRHPDMLPSIKDYMARKRYPLDVVNHFS